MRRRSNSRPKPSAPPFTSNVLASIRPIIRSARAMSTPRRSTAADAARGPPTMADGRRDSGHLATMARPSPIIDRPATTIATDKVVAQARVPKTTIPTAVPMRSKRPCAVRTRSMRSKRSSSSVIHATSAPLAIAHPSPHRHCDTTRSGKAVTRPVIAIPAPMTTWATTRARRRLAASANAPAGTSATTTVSPWNTPINTSCDGERSATTTRYSAVASHQPRASAARNSAHRRYAVVKSAGMGQHLAVKGQGHDDSQARPTGHGVIGSSVGRQAARGARTMHPRGVSERRDRTTATPGRKRVSVDRGAGHAGVGDDGGRSRARPRTSPRR